MLTLKQKLELFKLAKKPRRQIRLRLQVITNDLNLPSLHLSKQSLNVQLAAKHKRVMASTSNFKKVDKTKHNIIQLSVKNKQQDQKSLSCYKDIQNQRPLQSHSSFYHSNMNLTNLLNDFNFHLTKKEKQTKLLQQKQSSQNILTKQCSFIVSKIQKTKLAKDKNQQNFINQVDLQQVKSNKKLLGLKNQFHSLRNMNNFYKQQLKSAKIVQLASQKVSRVSLIAIRNQNLTAIRNQNLIAIRNQNLITRNQSLTHHSQLQQTTIKK